MKCQGVKRLRRGLRQVGMGYFLAPNYQLLWTMIFLDGTAGIVVGLTLVSQPCFKEKLAENEKKWKM